LIASSLPSGWRTLTLKEIASNKPNAIVDGPFGSNLKTDDYVESGVPVLQGKNITNDTFKWFDVRYISEKKANELKRSSVRQNDILVVKIGSIGYSAIVDSLKGYEFAIIPANLVKVTPNPDIVCTKYLHRWLTSPDAKRYLIANASKTAQPALSLGKIKELPVPFPPLPEQRRIAAILHGADALRAKRREALAQLDSLTQSIFIEMFGGTRYPTASLEDVCELITDGTHQTPQYANAGVIFLSAKNVTSGYINWDNIKFIPESLHHELHRRLSPKKNDVLLAKNGTTGVAAIVDRDCIFDIYVSLALLRAGPEVLPGYLLGAINSPVCSQQFSGALKGIGVPNLHLKEIRNTKVPKPPLVSQKTFTQRIEALEHQKVLHRSSLAELDALFASLQHRAFRGEL
jgi:type I restriction enzyme, S subunit